MLEFVGGKHYRKIKLLPKEKREKIERMIQISSESDKDREKRLQRQNREYNDSWKL